MSAGAVSAGWSSP